MSVHEHFAETIIALVEEYDEGDISIVRPGVDTGPEWDPQPGEPQVDVIQAVAKGVSARYVDDLVSASDIQVPAVPFGFEADLSHKIRIGTKDHEIIRIKRIPASGIVTAWILFVRA